MAVCATAAPSPACLRVLPALHLLRRRRLSEQAVVLVGGHHRQRLHSSPPRGCCSLIGCSSSRSAMTETAVPQLEASSDEVNDIIATCGDDKQVSMDIGDVLQLMMSSSSNGIEVRPLQESGLQELVITDADKGSREIPAMKTPTTYQNNNQGTNAIGIGEPNHIAPVAEFKQKWLGRVLNRPFLAVQSTISRLMAGTSNAWRKAGSSDLLETAVSEMHVQDLEVLGKIPEDLSGCFLRNGPLPRWTPVGGCHLVDGDGMVHACRIKDGRVHYSSHWIRTNRFVQEEEAGWASWIKLGDLEGLSGMVAIALAALKNGLGVISDDPNKGNGTANTALVYHAGQLLALHEGDLPYALRLGHDGALQTAGRTAYAGLSTFTSHPKIDSSTGIMHFFGYQLDKAPYLTYSAVDAAGRQMKSIPIDIPKPTIMHDFAITENHVIFIDTPLVFNPAIMIKEGGLPFEFDSERGIRFGVRRHDTPNDEEAVLWFTLPSCVILHVANAWEEQGGDRIHLHAFVMPKMDLRVCSDISPTLHHIEFNLQTGEAASTKMSTAVGDFPQIDRRLFGKPSRFAYAATNPLDVHNNDAADTQLDHGSDERAKQPTAVSKFDLQGNGCKAGEDAEIGTIHLGSNRRGGEPIFVPRADQCSEDDGYLITYTHDEASDSSRMVVYDAKTMSDEPVAEVVLPQSIPSGFHGLFLSEEECDTHHAVMLSHQ